MVDLTTFTSSDLETDTDTDSVVCLGGMDTNGADSSAVSDDRAHTDVDQDVREDLPSDESTTSQSVR